MEFRDSNYRHPFIQLLVFILIILISATFITLLSMIAGILLFKVPVSEWINLMDMNNPDNLPVLKFLQITQSLSIFVIPPIAFGWFMIRNPWNYLAIDRKPDRNLAGMVLLIGILILPVINLLGVINSGMQLPAFMSGIEEWMKRSEEQAAQLTESFLTVNSFGGYLVNVLMVVLIPAFGEEFFFRGSLQKIFQQWFRNPHVAIVFIAIIFSAFHMQFYGFLPRLTLGILFGYLFFWSGNIWYPVFAHMINNFLPVTLTYFFKDSIAPDELDKIGTGPEAWLWAIPALIASTWAIVYFYRTNKSLQKSET